MLKSRIHIVVVVVVVVAFIVSIIVPHFISITIPILLGSIDLGVQLALPSK